MTRSDHLAGIALPLASGALIRAVARLARPDQLGAWHETGLTTHGFWAARRRTRREDRRTGHVALIGTGAVGITALDWQQIGSVSDRRRHIRPHVAGIGPDQRRAVPRRRATTAPAMPVTARVDYAAAAASTGPSQTVRPASP